MTDQTRPCRGCGQPVNAAYRFHTECLAAYRRSTNYRQQTLDRDGYACARCTRARNALVLWFYAWRWAHTPALLRGLIRQDRRVEVDHIEPLAGDGTHDPLNMQVLCLGHHKRKTRRDLVKLRGKSRAPRQRTWLWREPRRLAWFLGITAAIILLTTHGGPFQTGGNTGRVPGYYVGLGAPATVPLPSTTVLIGLALTAVAALTWLGLHRFRRKALTELHASYAKITGASATMRRPIRARRWRLTRDADGMRYRWRPTRQVIRYPHTFRDDDPAAQQALEAVVVAKNGGTWTARWNTRANALTVTSPDPLASADALPWPLLNTDQTSLWDPIPVAIDERGRTVTVSLVEKNCLIGGEPGGGKSVAMQLLVAAACLDPDATVYGIDGKNLVELIDWQESMEELTGADDGQGNDSGIRDAIQLLGKLQLQMNLRYDILRADGKKKVTRDDGLGLIVLIIDELALFTDSGDKKLSEEFIRRLRDIISRGRAAGIIVIAATQRPSADVVPTRVRDLIGYRWAMRTATPATSDMVLGQGWASAGFSASKVQAAFRGVGFVLAEGATPVRCRSFMLDAVRDLPVVASRAARLRSREVPVVVDPVGSVQDTPSD